MKTILKRVLLVALVQLVAFEVLAQLGVHWRESTAELFDIALMLTTLLGLFWAVLPAFSGMHIRSVRALCRALLVLLSFVAMYALDYVYSWHLRPNLGLDQEPEWVAEHPAFQKELQARIESNVWRSPDRTPETTR